LDPRIDTSATPRIAVIIPCFNEGVALWESTASVLEDGGADERIIVDDGSTNPLTISIETDLERDGFRIVRQENKGPSAALMAGVAQTSAPFVFRLDSDDVLEPGALDELASALDGNPEAAAAWGDLKTFGLTDFRVPSNPVLDPWHVTFANQLPSCSMFRRSALLAVGGWQFRGGIDDWDLWMSLAENSYSGVYVPRVVYRYRRERSGLFAQAIGRFEADYDELKHVRHRDLFAARARNRRRSPAPVVLKALLPLVDRLPLLSRLRKVWLTQLLTNLCWNGGWRLTWPILRQGIANRMRPS
jgi:glycosyltransferase involved in cell wall biosynthesis